MPRGSEFCMMMRVPVCVIILATATTIASPIPLPEHLEFRRVDTTATALASSLQPLLQSSYIAVPDDSLALDYSAQDLSWMLEAPESTHDLRVAIGRQGAPDLVAFVCAVPSPLLLQGTPLEAVEVSLLCVHRDCRGQGLTKLLLAELRRRAAAAGVRCAIFTEARPRYNLPMLRAGCYHRPLRARALIRSGFWKLSGIEAENAIALSHLPRRLARSLTHPPSRPATDAPSRCTLRPLQPSDAPACHRLLSAYSSRFTLAPHLSIEHVRHRFLGRAAHSRALICAGSLVGFGTFVLVPLRTREGKRLIQAQLIGLFLAPSLGQHASSPSSQHDSSSSTRSAAAPLAAWREPAVLLLLHGLLRHARSLGAHVFNAHALAELTPELLERLGFASGDEATYVCLMDTTRGGGVPIGGGRMLDPAEASWLPLL